MIRPTFPLVVALALAAGVLAGCAPDPAAIEADNYVEPVGGPNYRQTADPNSPQSRETVPVGGARYGNYIGALPGDETIFDLFTNVDDPNVTLEVNRYIWTAALEILDFLPLESSDPFSGVFVTGYGVPPGGGQAYRATVYVQDPALDARALNVAMFTRSGPAAPETVRAVEDAILTRARQLRIRDRAL